VSEAKAQQNGDGRQSQAPDEGLSHRDTARRSHHDGEPQVGAAKAERPVVQPEARVEGEAKEDAGPPRRGWWQR
jgi:hypothetical protein